MAFDRELARLASTPLPIAWVRPENLHITLRFLGGVTPETAAMVVEGLRRTVAALSPFEIRFRRLGAFPSARRASIVWVGIEADGLGLMQLQSASESAARDAGLEPETRAFVPHLTIGRVRRNASRVDATPMLEREPDFSAGAMTVEAVSLFSSELTPQGARYTRLHRLTLDGLRCESGL